MIGAIISPLLTWYDAGHRDLPWRKTKNPYHIWLSEIMLQQTRVEAVIPYYERFLQVCPDIQTLAATPENVYLKLWEGLGYYSRVRNLHRAAQVICQTYGGQMPADYDALRTLPGIGDYTAGAIASIAFGIAQPAVDGNVLRVTTRLLNDTRSIDDTKVKKDLRALLAANIPTDRPGAFNQAMMELGATVCIPNGAPRCDICPLMHLCQAFQQKNTDSIPVRTPKKARRIQPRTVLLVRCGQQIGICQRPAHGLLARMWEFPAFEEHIAPQDIGQTLTKRGWPVTNILALQPAKHIFTHIEWHMIGYEIQLKQPIDQLTWVSAHELRHTYALPSAFRSFLSVLEEM